MQLRKILVPTDFSPGSEAALAMATSLARENDAKLLIVHVSEPNVVYTEGLASGYAALPQSQPEDAETLLQQIGPDDPSVPCERRVLMGMPADEIVRVAEEEGDVDLIVMGTHGRTGLLRFLMGSVAEKVVRKAPCPVMTFRHTSEQAVGS